MGNGIPPQKEEKNVGDAVAGFGIGLWESLESAAVGIWEIVSNPIDTVEGLYNVVTNPVETWDSITGSVSEYWEENWTNGDMETRSKLIGRILGEVALCLVGTKGVDKAAKSAKIAKSTQLVGKAEVGAKANIPAKAIKGKKGKGSKGNGRSSRRVAAEKKLSDAASGTNNRTIDPLTEEEVGRFIGDDHGNIIIEPVGGSTASAGRGGADTHTLYPNGSNYQRYNPAGHNNNSTPHGHLPGTGAGRNGQGASIDIEGNVVPFNSSEAHWTIH